MFLWEKIKGQFSAQKSNMNIIIEKEINFEVTLKHYEGHPSNYLFQLFLKLSGRPEEISSLFSNSLTSMNIDDWT